MGSSRDGHWLTTEERNAPRGPMFAVDHFENMKKIRGALLHLQNKTNEEQRRCRIGKVCFKTKIMGSEFFKAPGPRKWKLGSWQMLP
jgi:hypothetical protein